MKKTVIKLLLVVLAVCMLVCTFIACGGEKEPEHYCSYTQEVVDSKYLYKEATCTQRAHYYRSCECGEKGSEVFSTGEYLPHNYVEKVEDDYKISDATCTEKAKYYKVCECGQKSAKTDYFEAGEILEHTLLDHHDYDTHYKFCSACEQKFEVEEHTLDKGQCTKCVFYTYSKGLEYDLNNNGTYSDTSDDYYSVKGIGTFTGSNLVIPAVYENLPVKKILSRAFNVTTIVSADIPSSITDMYNAFYECENLETVTFRENFQLEDMSSAFLNCKKLENVSLPNGLTKVDGFSGCESLRSIVIPDSVETIGNSAFSRCKNLETVTFGKNTRVKTIENCAFMTCLKLLEFNLPTTVTYIGEYAFARDMANGGSYILEQTKTFHYDGTKEEFNKVIRASAWHHMISIKIDCTDGEIEN